MDKEPIAKSPALNSELVAYNIRNRAKAAKIKQLLEVPEVRDSAISRMNSDFERAISYSSGEERVFAFKTLGSLPSIVLSLEPFAHQYSEERRKTKKSSKIQSDRARKERVLFDGIALKEHIRRLFSSRERINDSPLQLWPHFLCLFRTLDPDAQIFDQDKNSKNWSVQYDYDPRRFVSMEELTDEDYKPTKRSFGYPHFRNTVRRLRQEDR